MYACMHLFLSIQSAIDMPSARHQKYKEQDVIQRQTLVFSVEMQGNALNQIIFLLELLGFLLYPCFFFFLDKLCGIVKK